MAAAAPDALDLALGELTYPLPQPLAKHAGKLLLTETPRYTPNAGLPALRNQVAAYYDHQTDESRVCITNGAEEALFVTLTALVNDGDLIAIPDPDYPAYPALATMVNARIVRLPYKHDLITIDWDQWASLLAKGVKFLLFSHPANPHGRFFSDNEIERLINICARNGIVLIVDEIYRELYFAQKPLSFAGRYDHLIVIGGLSKSHCMSGWRIGWITSPLSIAPAMIKTRQYVSTCSNWLSQMLAIYALSTDGLKLLASIRKRLHDNCRSAIGFIKDRFTPEGSETPSTHRITTIHSPDATPYIMIETGGDDVAYAIELAQRGIITAPGTAFGNLTRGWIRINASALDAPPKDQK